MSAQLKKKLTPKASWHGHDVEGVLLYCPVRGALGVKALAKDGLTPSEEARRIDFLNFLIEERSYPIEHIAVEVVTIKNLGEQGRNQLRADVLVYDCPTTEVDRSDKQSQLEHVILVAEIKRDASKKSKGIAYQLDPALRVLPRLDTVGVYWDDESRLLFTKSHTKRKHFEEIEVRADTVANLPDYGSAYQARVITADKLTKPTNLVAVLQGLANIMRSHGVNDSQVRYKETVKLLLARYVDEKSARITASKQLKMQLLAGADAAFMNRIQKLYTNASIRYARVKTLFAPRTGPELDESTMRDLVESIQGFDLSSASNDTMQQVFMTFIPAVFKKDLSQYFTPVSLIDSMVRMAAPGPTEKVADPAMGTADFLTSAMNYCIQRGDDDAPSRVYGADSDPQAYDLAITNMILNHDGQASLLCEDSIEHHARWREEMDVVFCNPPFGEKTTESRPKVLSAYDLGHAWERSDETGEWTQSAALPKSQQLGILFIEKCWKMLRDGGRMAIIVPEGYLSTESHGYVRQWILNHFIVRSLVELPRRIFLKSGADLRSNVLLAEKIQPGKAVRPYPIHASMVRRVGYKLGGDFAEIAVQDKATGMPVRDSTNKVVLDSDFTRVEREFLETPKRASAAWRGALLTDIVKHRNLDMKPRRLVPKALENIRSLRERGALLLSDIAYVVEDAVDLLDDIGPSEFRRAVEGQDIRAVEGIVVPQFRERCWAIAERKQRKMYELQQYDIVVGLVRPERRNIGMLLESATDIVGSPDGLCIVRVKDEFKSQYPQQWLFSVLRSEQVRLQFWTESGGTSYGKLPIEQIRATLIPGMTAAERKRIAGDVMTWAASVTANIAAWSKVGNEGDRRPILNSPLTGLFEDDDDGDAEFSEMTMDASANEDEIDLGIARARLREIAHQPELAISGEDLSLRLQDLLK